MGICFSKHCDSAGQEFGHHFSSNWFRGKIVMISKILLVCLIGVAYAAPNADPYTKFLGSTFGFGFAKFAKCEFPEGKGIIFISEKRFGMHGTTEIYGEMNGLTDGLHGFHVHEFGGLGNGCKDAGGHYDPEQTEDETGEYVGDLGSVNSINGKAFVKIQKQEIRLSGSEELSVLNRAMVVHADPEGGARVMCCTIKSPY